LLLAIHAALDPLGLNFEVVITDDRSSDGSWRGLQELGASGPVLGAPRLQFNWGEPGGRWGGVRNAKGRPIATLWPPLQKDTKDLPAMMTALRDFDCICGTRVETRAEGDSWLRTASSRIANWVRNKLSGENISDAGCTYRVFKRECISRIKFFNGAHRFLP